MGQRNSARSRSLVMAAACGGVIAGCAMKPGADIQDEPASATTEQTLIGETASEAKTNARALVGEAMAECERLLRTSGELSAEAAEIRTTLAKTVEDVTHHLLTLPGIVLALQTEQTVSTQNGVARPQSSSRAQPPAAVSSPTSAGLGNPQAAKRTSSSEIGIRFRMVR